MAYAAGPHFLHVIDLPYRLASWTLDKPQNFQFWHNAEGRLMAVAIMQEAFLSLEYIIHPMVDQAVLEPEILQWALQRGQMVANEQATTFPINVWLRSDHPQPERVALLQERGLMPGARQDVTMQCDLGKDHFSDEMFPVPNGFRIRPLRGQAEVAAYVELHQAAFGSTVMREGWRMRTLQMPQYRPELDLVAVAEDGRLAAFCIGWLHPQQPLAQIEPMGVHPDFHRLGLGQAILAAVLQRLQIRNIQFVSLFTTTDNVPAIKLYESVGFQKKYTMRSYRQLFHPATIDG
jgi:ribosomal protein S18 acetylase RimI-like enzyme